MAGSPSMGALLRVDDSCVDPIIDRSASAPPPESKLWSDGEEVEDDFLDEPEPLGIVLADARQKITHVNADFTAVTGYSFEESVGRNCNFLQGRGTGKEAVVAIREALLQQRACKVAILNYRKDGTPFWNWLSIYPLRDENGEVANYIGIQISFNRQAVPRPMELFPWAPPPKTPAGGEVMVMRRLTARARRESRSAAAAAMSPEQRAIRLASFDTPSPAAGRSVDGTLAEKQEAAAAAELLSSPSPVRAQQLSNSLMAALRLEDGDDSDEEGGKAEGADESVSTKVNFVAETLLPTRKGRYRVRAYRDVRTKLRQVGHGRTEEQVVSCSDVTCIIWGKVEGKSGVPMRVHDQCFTSEVLGSLKCDCKEQLDYAMEYIRDNRKGHGIVVYMQQEGRGIGLANKIKAYSVQELGYDTVDANKILGFADDYREYHAVPQILEHLGVKSVQLLTNNPRKISHLRSLGVKIDKRISIVPIQPAPELTADGRCPRHSDHCECPGVHKHGDGDDGASSGRVTGNSSSSNGDGLEARDKLSRDGGSVHSQNYLQAKQARMGHLL